MLHLITVVMAVVAMGTSQALAALSNGYHDYESMVAYMSEMATDQPQLCHLYSIGKSVEGKRRTL